VSRKLPYNSKEAEREWGKEKKVNTFSKKGVPAFPLVKEAEKKKKIINQSGKKNPPE